ncbi:sulfotransferase [Actibacterium atlanticum]|uniref:Sulfotransferase n=1 Tax=Actibacterium atlanticum TaxID=1461693 RepID=A0A058ZMA2_9RHOB|nr:sulfotransferase [Actibacterium atlanticum]KCV82322.1 sulfotransferase [Actibacterium atlanticum]
MPNKVNLFVLGVQKCGTTSLADLLNDHSQVFIPSIKETYFFNVDANFSKGFDWFSAEFYGVQKAQRAKWRGDATPFYLGSKEAIDRIAEYADSDARFIVILRDPVKRAVSAYQHMLRLGHETLSLPEALKKEHERIEEARAKNDRWWRFAYTKVGLYGEQIAYAQTVLGADRLLVLRQDELRDTPNLQQKLSDFLDLSAPFPARAKTNSNAASMPRFKLLRNILTRPNALKSLAQKILPRELRTKIGVGLNKLNAKKVSRIEIEPELEQEMRALFAKDQVALHEMGFSSHLD